MLFYLSGSIEYAPDRGRAWRSHITPMLHALGHDVYDPALDEQKNLTDDEIANFRSWKNTDLRRFQQTLRKIIAWDLDWIERSDAVLCFWEEHAQRGAGTQGELTFAHRIGIPVYLITGVPSAEISGWILGCASHIFPDFDSFRSHMQPHIALAKAPSQ